VVGMETNETIEQQVVAAAKEDAITPLKPPCAGPDLLEHISSPL
jgi:hypothetical protein